MNGGVTKQRAGGWTGEVQRRPLRAWPAPPSSTARDARRLCGSSATSNGQGGGEMALPCRPQLARGQDPVTPLQSNEARCRDRACYIGPLHPLAHCIILGARFCYSHIGNRLLWPIRYVGEGRRRSADEVRTLRCRPVLYSYVLQLTFIVMWQIFQVVSQKISRFSR